LRWAQKEGIAEGALRVQRVNSQRKILDTLTREEIADLEAAATAERDRLIIRLLGDAGLRLNELLTLTADSLVEQGRERYIRVDGKGARQRLVPLLPAVYARLRRFAQIGRPPETNSERIFVSLRRRPSGDYEPLDPRAVQQMIKATARRAGLKKPVHPHLLRHSFVTNALRRPGTNALTVAKIVGHSDMSMIASVYSHLNNSDAHQEMMRILRKED
jgi:integrase/recombinase XerD